MYDYSPTLSNVFNEDTCQKIEEKSHAVIIRDGDRRLIIQGSDQMHVLLAVSIVEDIVARVETNVGKSLGRESSAMLDNVLKRAYSNDGETEDGFDWSTMPEEVKRAVLVSLLDSDEPEITGVGGEGIADEQSESPGTASAVAAVVSSFASSSHAAAPASVTDTLSPATVSKVVDSPPKLDITDPAIQPLATLAMSKGYSLEEIENVLRNKTSQLKESEFLRILHTNRRLQFVTSQPVSVSSAFQQPVVSHDSIVNSSPSTSADVNVHVRTFDRSPVRSVTGSKVVHLQAVGAGRTKGANDNDVDSGVEGDGDKFLVIDNVITQVSPAAGSDTVVLLKSDEEMESSEVDDDNQNMEVEDVSAQLMVLGNESVIPNSSAVRSGEQTKKNVASELSGSPRRKKKKQKKKKKKQTASRTTMHQKTGTDVNVLDCISLIPTAASAAVDKSNSVVFVTDSSDSEDTDRIQPLVGHNEGLQLSRRKEERNQSPGMYLSSVSGNIRKTENHQNRTPLNIPAAGFTLVPTAASGG